MLRLEASGRPVLPDPFRPKGAVGERGKGEGRTQDLTAAFGVGAVDMNHTHPCRLILFSLELRRALFAERPFAFDQILHEFQTKGVLLVRSVQGQCTYPVAAV
jgi:hypothetical protein